MASNAYFTLSGKTEMTVSGVVSVAGSVLVFSIKHAGFPGRSRSPDAIDPG